MLILCDVLKILFCFSIVFRRYNTTKISNDLGIIINSQSLN